MRIPFMHYFFISILTLSFYLPAANGADDAVVQQSRGADQSIRYTDLKKFGPWDDRNYELAASDLALLAPNEHELRPGIPAFFRVELRREFPHLMKTGPAQYPRAALQLFYLRYGGLMKNGVIENDRRVGQEAAAVPINSEIQLNQLLGANEITVEINPSNPQQVVAGANNFGQEMYYSQDGGASWTIQGVLPNTCCDPTIDWSSDGSVAYVAALSGSIGVSAWRSFDGGVTWVDRVILTNSGSDKEFIHSDKSPASPHKDNVYLTYHNGNTMQFARSTDMGGSYSIQAFPGAPSGIGSDITTTPNGDIYYFYGAFNNKEIIMLKSTDGGVNFGAPTAIASTNGAFDFPIPSMESRRAWIYAATASDHSGGAYDGSVYVAWTDTISPENDGNPQANHTRIDVAYSRDGGTTWNLSTPHSTADMLTVDRWNQWLTVDENGIVHVVYYDTRNSVNRTGVDLYYTYSDDGAQTWAEPERISSQTSANLNDGQEFGDYNGISVVGAKLIPAWTDNRDGPPDQKDVYVADAENVAAGPGFTLSLDNASQQVCTPGNLSDINVDVGSLQGYVDPVTLSASGLPAGSSANFSVNPVTPGNGSVASIFFGAISGGDYSFDINGAGSGVDDRSSTVSVTAYAGAPGAANLVSPADGATDASTSPTLSWDAVAGAANYLVELDDDPAFGSIDFSTVTEDTSVAVPGLATESTFYWRVRAENLCDTGAYSSTFSFTTGLQICRTGPFPIPDGGASSDTLNVVDSGNLSDLNVSLKVSHTWVGDLSFTLVHEDTGTSVTLVDRPGVPDSQFGCSEDDIDAVLDDDGTASVESTCDTNPAIGGTLTPDGPLAAFVGENLAGNWRLDFSDSVTQDSGTVDEWCLLPALGGGGPQVCDLDMDGQIDRRDIRRLQQFVGRPAQPNDPRDADGDGWIRGLDVQQCRAMCTNPDCAP